MKCGQNGRELDAVMRYTWPGQDEAGVCALHAIGVRGVAEAMGFGLQILPIFPEPEFTVEEAMALNARSHAGRPSATARRVSKAKGRRR
jgi:hypothetical protein